MTRATPAVRGAPAGRGARPRTILAVSVAALALAGPGGVADARPPTGPGGGGGLEVVARGLDNPRGLTVLPGGVVLVAEAGRGGDGPCVAGTRNELCLGATGAVTAVVGGHQWRIASGLPSLRDPGLTEVLGPHDVALTATGVLVTVGLAADPARRPLLGAAGALAGQVVRLGLPGRHRAVADLAGFEAVHNPDGDQPGAVADSNPFGLSPDGAGVVVADAGGNDVLRVDARGRISTLAVFPVETVPGPGGGDIAMSFVPTSVVRGPDGAYYVGQETGFPFPVGGARVWRVVPGQPPTVAAAGFTSIIDIAFDARGRLLVLELASNGLLSGDPTGALVRVERDGRRTELARDGLATPVGVAVGPDGSIYVSNHGTSVGGGEVVRIRPPR